METNSIADMCVASRTTGGATRVKRFFPSRYAQTPLVPWLQARKIILANRRDQVVSGIPAECQKLGADDDADNVQTVIAHSGPAIAISIKTGHRRCTAELQFRAKNVFGECHDRFWGVSGFRKGNLDWPVAVNLRTMRVGRRLDQVKT